MRKNRFLKTGLLLVVAAGTIFWSCSPRRYAMGSGSTTPVSVPVNQNYFLFLSDVHLDLDSIQTDSGQDAGKVLWNSVKAKIDTLLNINKMNPPAFMLYTGDLPRHGLAGVNPSKWKLDVADILDYFKNLSATYGISILYMPGNNDSRNGNYCLFNDFGTAVPWFDPYPYIDFRVSKKSDPYGAYMLNKDAIEDGYYAAKIKSLPLRIISLNSVIWSASLKEWACQKDSNAQVKAGNKQMIWLGQQLFDAATAGDKVYLAMHIPPGIDAFGTAYPNSYDKVPDCTPAVGADMWRTSPDITPDWQYRFLDTIAKYRNTVAGVFFGHTHMDEFRMLHNPADDSIMQVAISCPGISVRNGNNPGFKLVYFDKNSLAPTDFKTIYSSDFDSSKPSFTGQYKLSDYLYPPNGSSILENLKAMDTTQRKSILRSIYTVKRDTNTTPCYYPFGLDVRSFADGGIEGKQ